MKKTMRKVTMVAMTPVRTRNVSQLVAYRVVGMTGPFTLLDIRRLVVNFPCVAISNLVMWPIVSIWLGIVMDDVILLSTRICGFTTQWSWDRELYAYRVFRMGNLGSPQRYSLFREGATNVAGKEPIEALINLWRLTDIVLLNKSNLWINDYKKCIWPKTLESMVVASASNTSILLNELVG
jgi:hypothetical protein